MYHVCLLYKYNTNISCIYSISDRSEKKVEIELERKKIIDISRPPYSYLLLPHIHIISRYFFKSNFVKFKHVYKKLVTTKILNQSH
jgi:hypothetical protein